MKMLLPVLLMLATGKTILPGEVKVKTLPPESREVLDYLPRGLAYLPPIRPSQPSEGSFHS